MKALTRLIALFSLLLVPALALAQKETETEYLLGVDDVIEISVKNRPEMTKIVTVTPDGKIAYAEVGELRATNKSTKALAKEIERELEKTYNNISVVVSVQSIRSKRIRIIGPVTTPGSFDYRPGMRLLDFIAMAGNIRVRPSMVRGNLVRSDGKVISINIAKAISDPKSDENLAIQVDDFVVLDELDPAKRRVFVMGRVGKPGPVEMGDDPMNILAVLTLAGSTMEDAALSQVTVLRGKTEIPIDLRSAISDGKPDEMLKSFFLQPEDVLFVPQNKLFIQVGGAINKPGQVAMPEKKEMRVMEAISAGGSIAQNADTRKIYVLRFEGNKVTKLDVDMDKFIKKSDATQNILLKPNDVVFVPLKGAPGLQPRDMLQAANFLALFLRR